MAVKPEKYSPDYKGYLTYPAHEKINGVLLEENRRRIHTIKLNNQCVDTHALTPELKKLLLDNRGKVETKEYVTTQGKTKIFDIPVSIRKILKRSKLDSIRIRVTGKTIQEVIKKLDDIKHNMVKWGIEPTECIWDRENLS